MSCWDVVSKVLTKTDRVLLYGPSGTGKSYAGKRFGIKPDAYDNVYSFSLTEDTPAAELRGHFGLKGGEYVWMDGPCVSAWRKGTRLVLNELEKASGDAQTFLLGILDDMDIANITLPSGEMVKPLPGFHCVATMNGEPSDLNAALRDRFPVTIHVDEVAPGALKALPDDIRELAKRTGLVKDEERRISVRSWKEFALLRPEVGDEMAARAIFGAGYKDVMAAFKLRGAKVSVGSASVSVILESFGSDKIKVIKYVRAMTGLGLKETKDLVENLPNRFVENISEDRANGIKAELERCGAKVSIDGGRSKTPAKKPTADKLNISISDLGLSVRATNCLEGEGITTVGHLVGWTAEKLLCIRNFNVPALAEVHAKITSMGLRLSTAGVPIYSPKAVAPVKKKKKFTRKYKRV